MTTEVMRVTIRDVTYETAQEAADALGVKRCTVYSALHRGTTDTLGLGTGARKVKKGGIPKKVSLGAMQFDSLAEASAYLGYKKKTLSSILRRGKATARQNVMRRFLEKAAQIENSRMREQRDVTASSPTRG